MSDPGFGAAEFALGSIRGNRAWKVDSAGILHPISMSSGDWTVGENVAVCKGVPSSELIPYELGDWQHYYAQVGVWRSNHQMIDCKHGFYAYFQGERDQYADTIGVRGVIEGYGEVLVGSKGFRATKARIVALCVGGHDGTWNLDQRVIDLIHDNYPGAAIFRTDEKMRAEFPADTAKKFETAGA